MNALGRDGGRTFFCRARRRVWFDLRWAEAEHPAHNDQ
jgi:hypothetical protein